MGKKSRVYRLVVRKKYENLHAVHSLSLYLVTKTFSLRPLSVHSFYSPFNLGAALKEISIDKKNLSYFKLSRSWKNKHRCYKLMPVTLFAQVFFISRFCFLLFSVRMKRKRYVSRTNNEYYVRMKRNECSLIFFCRVSIFSEYPSLLCVCGDFSFHVWLDILKEHNAKKKIKNWYIAICIEKVVSKQDGKQFEHSKWLISEFWSFQFGHKFCVFDVFQSYLAIWSF